MKIDASPVNASNSVGSILESDGRKIHSIKGDGNCLFRALAYAILGDEDYHLVIRTGIVRLLNLNEEIFSHYLISGVNKPTISEQVHHMLQPRTWGTHLEIIAAATLFQIPVYFCSQDPASNELTWAVHRPVNSAGIRLPSLMDEEYQSKDETITHVELFYYQLVHYDVIISTETNTICTTPPQLTGKPDPKTMELD